jgi:hypothetical protein
MSVYLQLPPEQEPSIVTKWGLTTEAAIQDGDLGRGAAFFGREYIYLEVFAKVCSEWHEVKLELVSLGVKLGRSGADEFRRYNTIIWSSFFNVSSSYVQCIYIFTRHNLISYQYMRVCTYVCICVYMCVYVCI